MTANLCLTWERGADALLEANPFALLVGMLLDQQVQTRLRLSAKQALRALVGDAPR